MSTKVFTRKRSYMNKYSSDKRFDHGSIAFVAVVASCFAVLFIFSGLENNSSVAWHEGQMATLERELEVNQLLEDIAVEADIRLESRDRDSFAARYDELLDAQRISNNMTGEAFAAVEVVITDDALEDIFNHPDVIDLELDGDFTDRAELTYNGQLQDALYQPEHPGPEITPNFFANYSNGVLIGGLLVVIIAGWKFFFLHGLDLLTAPYRLGKPLHDKRRAERAVSEEDRRHKELEMARPYAAERQELAEMRARLKQDAPLMNDTDIKERREAIDHLEKRIERLLAQMHKKDHDDFDANLRLDEDGLDAYLNDPELKGAVTS